MYRVQLSPAEREELQARTRAPGLAPQTRDRLEMVRLSDAGWSVPRIARHLGCHEQTVRKYIKAFLAGGFERLRDRPRPGRPRRLTEAHLEALDQLLDETERTWTTPQLVDWLRREHGVSVHPDYLSVLLKRRRFRWKRTKRSLTHKQGDPTLQAAAETALEELKKSGPVGADRAVVPRPERLRPDPADRLHLGADRGAYLGALRSAGRSAGERGRRAGAVRQRWATPGIRDSAHRPGEI